MADDDYEEANAEVEHILAASKPRHLGEGLTSGIGYILRGAVGACGAVVVSEMNEWYQSMNGINQSINQSINQLLLYLIKSRSGF